MEFDSNSAAVGTSCCLRIFFLNLSRLALLVVHVRTVRLWQCCGEDG